MEYKIGDKVKIVKANSKRVIYKNTIKKNLNKIFEVVEVESIKPCKMPIRVKSENNAYLWLYEDEFELVNENNTDTVVKIEKIYNEIKKLQNKRRVNMEYKVGDQVKIININKRRPTGKSKMIKDFNNVFEIVEIDKNSLLPIRVKMSDNFLMWLYEDEFEIVKKGKPLKDILKQVLEIEEKIKKLEKEKEELLNVRFMEVE